MTDGPDRTPDPAPPAPLRTDAEIIHSRWPGWIWAVPLAVLGVVAWLVLRHFAERGPAVTVRFAAAEGVKPDDTKVRYRGVEVGTVQDVQLASDLGGVIVTLRLNRKVADALRAGTRFWIAGTAPTLDNLSSVKTVLSGPFIGMDPGGGPPARAFVGLAGPPQVMNGIPGRRFLLHAEQLGTIAPGTRVDYHGLEVGTVESARFLGEGRGFDVAAFIRAPYDGLVHANSRFWMVGTVSLSLGATGVQARLSPLSALLTGAVEFDLPRGLPPGSEASPRSRFSVYETKAAAEGAPFGPQVPFRVRFSGAAGGLAPGAAVTLEGFPVGRVTTVDLEYDARTGRLSSPVGIEVEPRRLRFLGLSAAAAEDWPRVVTAALARLVGEGLRARLESSTPVIGPRQVALAMAGGSAGPPAVPAADGVLEIPPAPSADVNALLGQAREVLAGIQAVPLARIGADLNDTSRRVAALVSSPQVAESLGHLDRTLAHLEVLSRDADRQVGPLIASLRQTAQAAQQAVAATNAVMGGSGAVQNRNLPTALDELTRAARSIRELADYLNDHPEALVTGRRP